MARRETVRKELKRRFENSMDSAIGMALLGLGLFMFTVPQALIFYTMFCLVDWWWRDEIRWVLNIPAAFVAVPIFYALDKVWDWTFGQIKRGKKKPCDGSTN